MNFPEKHSHKWAKTLARAKAIWSESRRLNAACDAEGAKARLRLLVDGDFSKEADIFPGLKICGAYWRAVEGEMNLRFEVLHEFSGWKDAESDPEYRRLADGYYARFVSDVREILDRDKLFPWEAFAPYAADFDTVKLGAGWIPNYQGLCARADAALASGDFGEALLVDWFVYCVRGVTAYDYGLIRQGVLSRLLIERQGFDRLKAVVDASADEFGWRVTRLFFAKMYPEAGIDGMALRQLGRYGMFADQDLLTTERPAPAGKEDTEPSWRITEFFNCEERGIFEVISAESGIPLSKLGLGVCVYCHDHAKKTAGVFTPPDRTVHTSMVRALGLGDESCLFETAMRPGEDMERFMEHQEKVFYAE
ncbi:MAG: hypothetical protein JNG85_02160 [Spirochaetaceae bacterium]|nr:hypothetical protein [Spirochaetaceae bacterium]